MISFLVGTLIWTVVLGLFMGFMFTADMKGISRLFATIVIAIVIGAIVSAVMTAQYYSDKRQWNNGYCPNCNVRWELVNVEHVRNSGERYYWDCPQCGDIIELQQQF